MSWNHRVIRHVKPDDDKIGQTDGWLAIHEVYYDDDGKPDGCTTEPINLIQENVKDMKWEVEKIMECLDKPVIDYSYFEELEKKHEESKDND